MGTQLDCRDQEIRFTVHDSPDYYQLKVSVFNDDKKTELIGETWIDLRDIIIPGGGQSDQWHQLGCRGKYAGEVRIEITYYDNRPKPEKLPVKAKPPVPADTEAAPTTAGGRTVPKRRPLPSDPVTGKPPAPSSPAAELGEGTPPRPPLNPAPVPHQAPLPQPDHGHDDASRDLGTPSRRADAPTQQYRTPDRAEQYAIQQGDQGYSPQYQQPGYERHDSYDFQQPNDRAVEDDRPPPPPAHRSRTGSNPSMNTAFQATLPTMRQDVLRSEAHRNSVSGSYPGRPTYKAYDSAPAGLVGAQYSIADPGPPARHYSYDPAFEQHRTMQATVEDVPESPESSINPHRRTSGGRWIQPQSQSQPHFGPDYDLTASPAPLSLSARASIESARYGHGPDQPRYQGSNGFPMGPSEVPRRESLEYAPNYGRHSEPSLPPHGSHPDQRALTYHSELDDTSNGYSMPSVPPSLVPGVDPAFSQEISERVNQDRRQSTQTRGYSQQAMVEASPRGYPQQALVETAPRGYPQQALVETQARGYSQHALVETPPRGRSMKDRYSHDAAYNTVPPAHSRSPVMYTNGPSTSSVNVVIKSRAYSPNPPRDPSPNPHHQHTIRRKSVSPRPPTENTRLSGVPFGPDSYDALNPSVGSAAFKDATASRPDYHEATGKIITHDGREVDPSDHLPMESWAPEPEPKPNSSSTSSGRPSPSGPQPVPSSGRRPLRIAGRPQSMLPSTSVITFSGSEFAEPITTSSPPVSAGRNRLQKKAAYRQSTSATVPVMSGANNSPAAPRPGSSGSGGNRVLRRRSSAGSGHAMMTAMDPTPLAPIPPHQDNFTPPRHLPRAATFDYAAGSGSENYAPSHHHSHSGGSIGGGGGYGTSPGSGGYGHGHGHQYSRSGGGAPPIPAKVPLALPPPPGMMGTSGALQLHSSSVARRAGMDDGYSGGGGGGGYHHQQQQYDGYGGGGGGGGRDLSLEEEMRQIDIGTGRSSRRHGGQGQGQGYGGGGGGQGYGSVYGQGGY